MSSFRVGGGGGGELRRGVFGGVKGRERGARMLGCDPSFQDNVAIATTQTPSHPETEGSDTRQGDNAHL